MIFFPWFNNFESKNCGGNSPLVKLQIRELFNQIEKENKKIKKIEITNKNNKKIYNLISYKGKFTIIQDREIELDALDFVVGEITHEQALKEAQQRSEDAQHYGVPAYVGYNDELNKVFN